MDRAKSGLNSFAKPIHVAAYTLIAALVVLAIVVMKQVFMPIVFATVFAFVLSPIVRLLERRRMPTALAVGTVVTATACVLLFVALIAGQHLGLLLRDLPSHTATIKSKVELIRGSHQHRFARLWHMWDEVAEAAFPHEREGLGKTTEQNDTGSDNSAVVIRERRVAAESGLSSVLVMLGHTLHPIGLMAVVVVLVSFLLVGRSDIYNRILAVVGVENFVQTNFVIRDAGSRLSRYLLTLTLINFGSAAAFGVGLALLGIPYAFLCALIVGFFRFVPYVGTISAASLAAIIALATRAGWWPAISVIVLFCIIEFTISNFIEPLLFGQSVGLNPLGVLLSFLVWTWAWGAEGLILAVPMTIMIVVFAGRIPQLSWITTLLGNEPPLREPIAMYQRLIAGDVHDAARLCGVHVDEATRRKRIDERLVPALSVAKREYVSSTLTRDSFERVLSTVQQTCRELSKIVDGEEPGRSVAIIPVDDGADVALAECASAALQPSYSASVVPLEAAIQSNDVAVSALIVTCLPNHNMRQLVDICRSLTRRFEGTPLFVLYGKPLSRPVRLQRYLRKLIGARVGVAATLERLNRLVSADVAYAKIPDNEARFTVRSPSVDYSRV